MAPCEPERNYNSNNISSAILSDNRNCFADKRHTGFIQLRFSGVRLLVHLLSADAESRVTCRVMRRFDACFTAVNSTIQLFKCLLLCMHVCEQFLILVLLPYWSV